MQERVPYPSRRQLPISYEHLVGKLSFREGACDHTSSMGNGSNIAIQSQKSLVEGYYGTYNMDLPQGSICHVLEASITHPKH